MCFFFFCHFFFCHVVGSNHPGRVIKDPKEVCRASSKSLPGVLYCLLFLFENEMKLIKLIINGYLMEEPVKEKLSYYSFLLQCDTLPEHPYKLPLYKKRKGIASRTVWSGLCLEIKRTKVLHQYQVFRVKFYPFPSQLTIRKNVLRTWRSCIRVHHQLFRVVDTLSTPSVSNR